MGWAHTVNMFEIKRKLKVPAEVDVRKRLRLAVQMYVNEHMILPPSDLETLEYHAGKLVPEQGFSEEYIDFTIVLLGNEAWRKTVAATPFNRRLLILPQCLRNSLLCQAEVDSFGVICAGCQNCRIDRIITEAEELGYTTLVAEGTTVAIGLVEEGSIDAVVGVSCMPVLQKSFDSVTRAAIPAVAIPLLDEGCADTDMDYAWLFDEMSLFINDPESRPLSVFLLKNQVDGYFSPAQLMKFFPSGNNTEKLVLKVMGMGGHRMRPLLSVLSYQSYARVIEETIQETLSVMIECFHKASLIHDDIEDNENVRYNQPALHRTEGIPMAVNVGDYLVGAGYRLLASLPTDQVIKTRCLEVVASSHVKLSQGQGSDLKLQATLSGHSVEEVLEIFRQKTGEAVKVALLTGAICGDAPEDDKRQLGRFSEYFGIAYQIRDDLNEFEEEETRVNPLNFPFLLALLERELKTTKHSFHLIMQVNDIKLLEDYFLEFAIVAKAHHYLRKFTDKCYRILDNLQNQKLRLSLYGVMGKVFKI